MLIGGNGDANAGAAEQQRLVAFAGNHRTASGLGHIRVIAGFAGVAAEILVGNTDLIQMLTDGFLQFVAAMVGGKGNGFGHGIDSPLMRAWRSRSAWLSRR